MFDNLLLLYQDVYSLTIINEIFCLVIVCVRVLFNCVFSWEMTYSLIMKWTGISRWMMKIWFYRMLASAISIACVLVVYVI